jgi:hypothetical protein
MVTIAEWNVEGFRKRIQAMTDEKLVQMGKAARYMADPKNSANRCSVELVFIVQLQECREEWKRRHPKAK